MAGIYIHVPFCQKKCIYCGFYSVVNSSLLKQYILALKREILERKDFFTVATAGGATGRISTLYIGGGTPSVLTIYDLEEIVRAVTETFGDFVGRTLQHPDTVEFTIEVNPDDITPEYAAGLKALGVNRVSMGVQSFNNEHLRWMRRRHTAQQAIMAFDTLRAAGFSNISIDLIFGYEGLGAEEWKVAINQAVGLAPEHISAYQMSLDEKTSLELLARKGQYTAPSDESCAEQYALLQEVMCNAGYEQYEVSNFCKPGFYSRHNSNYWRRIPYLGLGPGAHSFIGHRRLWNKPDVVNYCKSASLSDSLTTLRGSETLSDIDIYNEIIMLRLRTTKGLILSELSYDERSLVERYLFTDRMQSVLSTLRQGKSLIVSTMPSDIILKIPPEKLFVSDGIILQLMY